MLAKACFLRPPCGTLKPSPTFHVPAPPGGKGLFCQFPYVCVSLKPSSNLQCRVPCVHRTVLSGSLCVSLISSPPLQDLALHFGKACFVRPPLLHSETLSHPPRPCPNFWQSPILSGHLFGSLKPYPTLHVFLPLFGKGLLCQAPLCQSETLSQPLRPCHNFWQRALLSGPFLAI